LQVLTEICIAGIAFPTTVSPNDVLTPYTPIASDSAEAQIAVKEGDILKIQSVLPRSP
jgi:methionine aminopeptidase